MLRLVQKIVGTFLMLAAIGVWFTFDHAAPGPLLIWQVLNWALVAVVGGSGWFVLTLDRTSWPRSPGA